MDHNLINIQQNGVLNESEPLINQEIKMTDQQESKTNRIKDKVSSGITDFKHDFINFFKQNGLSDYWDYLLLFIRFIQSLLSYHSKSKQIVTIYNHNQDCRGGT